MNLEGYCLSNVLEALKFHIAALISNLGAKLRKKLDTMEKPLTGFLSIKIEHLKPRLSVFCERGGWNWKVLKIGFKIVYLL